MAAKLPSVMAPGASVGCHLSQLCSEATRRRSGEPLGDVPAGLGDTGDG